MRKLTRHSLSPETLEVLVQRTARVMAEPDAKARSAMVHHLWQRRTSRAFQEVREALGAMASGLVRCMYCEDSQGTDIEHFRPKRQYPEHAFEWTNYLLACSHCNSNEKRDQFPLDEHGQPLLIDPTSEDPGEHLLIVPNFGKLEGLTPKGNESIRVFGLSRAILEKGRKRVWNGLVFGLIPRYAEARRRGDEEATRNLLDSICQESFSSVLWHLLRMAKMPGAAKLLRKHPECLTALREFGDELATAAGFTQ